MSWMLSSCGVRITSGLLIGSIADKLESVVNVVSLLSRLDHCKICLGNADGKFRALMSEGRFMKSSGMYKVAQSTNSLS